MDKMVVIEGKQLEMLRKALTISPKSAPIHTLRIAWHGDSVSVKINEHIWSAPMGRIQEPY